MATLQRELNDFSWTSLNRKEAGCLLPHVYWQGNDEPLPHRCRATPHEIFFIESFYRWLGRKSFRRIPRPFAPLLGKVSKCYGNTVEWVLLLCLLLFFMCEKAVRWLGQDTRQGQQNSPSRRAIGPRYAHTRHACLRVLFFFNNFSSLNLSVRKETDLRETIWTVTNCLPPNTSFGV